MKRIRYLNRTRLHRNLIHRSNRMDESASIDQQCILIKEQGASMSTENLTTSFNTIVISLNKGELLKNVETIQKIVTTLSSQKFFETNLLDHQLFVIIRDLYLDILYRWRRGEILNQSTRQIFCEVSSLFAGICFYRHSLKKAFNF
jgi:hypothetical protein